MRAGVRGPDCHSIFAVGRHRRRSINADLALCYLYFSRTCSPSVRFDGSAELGDLGTSPSEATVRERRDLFHSTGAPISRAAIL